MGKILTRNAQGWFYTTIYHSNDKYDFNYNTMKNYNKEEVMKSLIFCSQNAKEVDPLLEASWHAGREEMKKPLREALRMLEDEIPFTGEEVIAKIKEALK